MRIALHADGRSIRGNENQLLLLVRGLVRRGHEVHAACVPGTPVASALATAGAHVSGARPRGDAELLSAARFLLWLRRTRPDVVLLTSWKRAALTAALARLARAPRIVIRVGGEHGSRGGTGDALRRRALSRWIDAVWANCEPVRERLFRYAPAVPPERVRVIPSAVEPFTGAPLDLRAELGLPQHAPLLFSAGGLEHRKGYDVLLDALASFPHGDVHLAIAGDGPDRALLARRAQELGLANRLHLLGQRRDVPALLPRIDAFVLPSRSDSVPIAALEAAAAGRPVVSTDVPGMRELLGSRPDAPAAGWIVPIDDAAALARALAAALDPSAAAAGQEVRRRILLDHTPERLVERVEALLAGDSQ